MMPHITLQYCKDNLPLGKAPALPNVSPSSPLFYTCKSKISTSLPS
jgi:hypothetical protein